MKMGPNDLFYHTRPANSDVDLDIYDLSLQHPFICLFLLRFFPSRKYHTFILYMNPVDMASTCSRVTLNKIYIQLPYTRKLRCHMVS